MIAVICFSILYKKGAGIVVLALIFLILFVVVYCFLIGSLFNTGEIEEARGTSATGGLLGGIFVWVLLYVHLAAYTVVVDDEAAGYVHLLNAINPMVAVVQIFKIMNRYILYGDSFSRRGREEFR